MVNPCKVRDQPGLQSPGQPGLHSDTLSQKYQQSETTTFDKT